MPLSSAEIAQLNATFQAQAMNQQSYAGMIGQGGNIYGGGYQGQGGDRGMPAGSHLPTWTGEGCSLESRAGRGRVKGRALRP